MKINIPSPPRPVTDLIGILPDLASTAQSVYDGWDQIDGFDVELGEGGICQDVASAMAGCLSSSGFDDVLTVSAAVGENHVFLVALLADGVYQIDISPYHYETGGGYVWKKRPGIKFSSDMISFMKVEGVITPDEFIDRYSDC